MEKIEFYGSSLLIPMFLVSVGTVIDPRVLLELGHDRRRGRVLRRVHRRQALRVADDETAVRLLVGRSRHHVLALGRASGGNARGDVHRVADRIARHECSERDHARDHPEPARVVDHRAPVRLAHTTAAHRRASPRPVGARAHRRAGRGAGDAAGREPPGRGRRRGDAPGGDRVRRPDATADRGRRARGPHDRPARPRRGGRDPFRPIGARRVAARRRVAQQLLRGRARGKRVVAADVARCVAARARRARVPCRSRWSEAGRARCIGRCSCSRRRRRAGRDQRLDSRSTSRRACTRPASSS